jgi:hypothetical protein
MSAPDESDFELFAPPWKVFPKMDPEDLPRHLTQGAAESYFDHAWRPFWNGLTPEQRRRYLAHWNASPAWLDALQIFERVSDLDLEADAAESDEYLKRWRGDKEASDRESIWKRLFRRNR